MNYDEAESCCLISVLGRGEGQTLSRIWSKLRLIIGNQFVFSSLAGSASNGSPGVDGLMDSAARRLMIAGRRSTIAMRL